ncbi:MAG: hypothetical protein DCF20_19210 [Pseudanabaena sp.]|nr:MAG: hypothetical protein DCF20_19210 [Pseudanabaena sp.]
MLSIAELAHKRDPRAITEIICHELQPLDIKQLDVAVDIVDSSLELQIRTDSAFDKQKLLTLVHSKLQDLHIESIAKFKIHCWRKDEEMQEHRLLWTEKFMLDMPKSSPRSVSISDLQPLLDNSKSPEERKSETRSPEPKLSKHFVLQQAISKIFPTHNQPKPNLLASNLNLYPATESLVNSSSLVLSGDNRQKMQSPDSNYWQVLLVGLSIVLLGLGIGASVRALTAKSGLESNTFSSVLAPSSDPSVDNKAIRDTPTTSKITPSQTSEPSAVTTQTTSKANPSTSVESIAPRPNDQAKESVTLEKFNRIQKGMTIEQVNKIFGVSGKVIAENNSSNSIGQVYSWKNPQGSNAIIEFKDGQVVAKAQAGL